MTENEYPPDWATRAVVTFCAQVWNGDYAILVWEETYLVPIAAVTDDNGQVLEDNSHKSDQLRWHADAPDRVQNWSETGFVTIKEFR